VLNTLRYWLEVEALTFPDAGAARERRELYEVRHVRAGGDFPWLDRRLLGEHFVHFVRFGIIPKRPLNGMIASLFAACPAEKRDDGRRRREEGKYTFLGLFAADRNGRPVPGSLKLAAFAPALASRLKEAEPSFRDYAERAMEEFTKLLEEYEDRQAPCDLDFLLRLTRCVRGILDCDLPSSDAAPAAVIRSERLVWNRRRRDPAPPPVNGFFFDDLSAVIRQIEAGSTPPLVSTYLTPAGPDARTDCTDLEVVEAALEIAETPEGKWPSGHPPALMQQVAVNAALDRLASGGLFSVNGPPGTGKTTLLMDLIAAVVVERAKALAEYERPRAAFTRGESVVYPKGSKGWSYHLDERLHDFSMVVASSNNGAVENITRELPNAESLGERFRAEASYFPEATDALLNDESEDPDPEGAAQVKAERIRSWGLISAALGNASNRHRFTRLLTGGVARQGEPFKRAAWNLEYLISEARSTADWQQARLAFEAALGQVRGLRREIGEIEALARQSADLADAARRLEAASLGHDRDRLRLQEQEQVARERLVAAKKEAGGADSTVADLRESKPSFLPYLLRLRLRDYASDRHRWEAEYRAALAARARCNTARGEAEGDLERLARERRSLSEVAKRASAQLAAARQHRKELSETLESKKAALGGAFHDGRAFAALPEADRQLSLPRSHAALEDARSRAFLRAMDLHKAFLAEAGPPVLSNLNLALDMIVGKNHVEPLLPAMAADLWATLFLAVPVVSTTFHSFAATFGSVPPGGIAWLFVDEAGQAVPHHAVGALWRSKRAVVVGDPFQVPPVVTFDESCDDAIREKYGAPLEHAVHAHSVQTLADRANPFGAWIGERDREPVWVGCPLRVHRRCAEPMFSISNAIAYGNSMVPGLDPEEERFRTERRPLLGTSRWFDIKSRNEGRGHFVTAQAEHALDVVRLYLEHRLAPRADGLPDLYIVSPFRSVADGMKGLLRRARDELAPAVSSDRFEAWVKASVGTVHTFQGKEAETVILLLGGISPGAIGWAAEQPNILNVAVTRARRRLYVIGDRGQWVGHGCFRSLARLPCEVVEPDFLATVEDWGKVRRLSRREQFHTLLDEVLESARERVVICSPYLSLRAVRLRQEGGSLAERIAHAAQRVEVVVWTSHRTWDDERYGTSEAVRLLAAGGATVVRAEEFHSKTLIMDRRLIAEGSLNWLSAHQGGDERYQKLECVFAYEGRKAPEFIAEALADLEALRLIDRFEPASAGGGDRQAQHRTRA
jgi:hypothetical protein